MSKNTYTGKNREQIEDYVLANGNLNGVLTTALGKSVTDVSFEIVNGNLVFKANGTQYANPTQAIIALEPVFRRPGRNSVGCKEGTAGNAVSNVIADGGSGLNLFQHIKFGSLTLKDIVDLTPRRPNSKSLKTKSNLSNVTVKPVHTPAENLAFIASSQTKLSLDDQVAQMLTAGGALSRAFIKARLSGADLVEVREVIVECVAESKSETDIAELVTELYV
jgi:hypothetical protein